MKDLVAKYNVPAPRYTSYPAVPHWHRSPSVEEWLSHVRSAFKKTNAAEGISLYIHLPFCESLCTYCACNTRITVNHKVEEPYIRAVLKEWDLYLQMLGEKPRIRELHLGGGTPTFFSPTNLSRLVREIIDKAQISPDHDFSFEGHPANTTSEHLQTLFDLGFRRVSFGIQDFDPVVQEAINRYQSIEQVQQIIQEARRIGYTSVNLDLVYGLPHQSLQSITSTLKTSVRLKPERIAFYSYAHVPWIKPGQRKFSEADLPADIEKRKLYEKGTALFTSAGYAHVGMDHFALPGDNLYEALKKKRLHRNFMGYTDKHSTLMIGLGVSAISNSRTAFSQNVKELEKYLELISAGNLPVLRGHVLSERDQMIGTIILNIMCQGEAYFESDQFPDIKEKLEVLKHDGLINLKENLLEVTEPGRSFLRNIAMCFDDYLKKPVYQAVFSTAV